MNTLNLPPMTRQNRVFFRWGQKVVYDLFLNLRERMEELGAEGIQTLDNEGDIGIAFDYDGSRYMLKSGITVTVAKNPETGNKAEARALKFLLQLERGALPKLQVEIAEYDIDFAGTRDQAVSLNMAAEDLAEKIHGFVSGKLA